VIIPITEENIISSKFSIAKIVRRKRALSKIFHMLSRTSTSMICPISTNSNLLPTYLLPKSKMYGE